MLPSRSEPGAHPEDSLRHPGHGPGDGVDLREQRLLEVGGHDGDRERHVADLRAGGFKVCFSQGLNVRIINARIAAALRSVEYRDTRFRRRRPYMAWDSLGDEMRFFRGIDCLEKAGIPAKHVMAYMLIGYDPDETFADIEYRFGRMAERGILPYPMVYDRSVDLHRPFQRWAVTGLYRAVPFSEYRHAA